MEVSVTVPTQDVKVYGEGLHPGPGEADNQRVTDQKLAEMLESLAAGNTIRLGEFSDGGNSQTTWTDVLAGQLEEIVYALKEGSLQL